MFRLGQIVYDVMAEEPCKITRMHHLPDKIEYHLTYKDKSMRVADVDELLPASKHQITQFNNLK